MRCPALPCALAAILAACAPAAAPAPAPAAIATPADAQAPAAPSRAAYVEASAEPVDCEHVGALFDSLRDAKAGGMTEAAALDDMRNRGELVFGGPLVDAVFGDRFGEPGSVAARAEMLAACRRVAAGGSMY